MGAYLYFKTLSSPDAVNDYLETNTLQKKLREIEEQGIWVVDQHHIKWCKENRPDLVKWETSKLGTGDIKTSGGISFKADEAGYDAEDLLEMWTQIFEELNKRFEMKYYANSCAFSEDGHYFSLEQMKRITQKGKLLSGKSSKSEHVVELYNKYFALLSEPESIDFDISIVKERDELKVGGNWYKVHDNWRGLCIQKGYQYIKLEDIEEIEEYKKNIPKIRYMGAVCDVEAVIEDSGTLIYLETIGQESMVKSVTSVLMQGRVRMNDHAVDASFGYFDINKAGNKRKMVSLDDGLAHAILYHSPSIVDTNFSVLIGRDKKELMRSFDAWLEKSQPLPYPKELSQKLYEKLEEKSKLKELTTHGIEAVKVDMAILEDEAHDLQELIIEVCKENGLIALDAKPMKQKAPLPKSPLLTAAQVQKIYDTLEQMPKTYELEDMKIKPVGLKLFTSGFTWYVVEADKGSEDDEFAGLHPQAFGYVVNEQYEEGEWGYINIEEIVSVGAEMDLYFEDMFISTKGTVGTMEEIVKLQNTPSCPNCGNRKGVEQSETIDEFHCTNCGFDFNTKEVA